MITVTGLPDFGMKPETLKERRKRMREWRKAHPGESLMKMGPMVVGETRVLLRMKPETMERIRAAYPDYFYDVPAEKP